VVTQGHKVLRDQAVLVAQAELPDHRVHREFKDHRDLKV
jgi:hypothetical protein